MPSRMPQSATTPAAAARIELRGHLLFVTASAILLLLMFSLLRLALLAFNSELIGDTPLASLAEAFGNGVRFDLRVVVFICAPQILALSYRPALQARGWQRLWLSAAASLCILLGLIELDFYREFHQRLNSLVFQYLREDPATVLSMLWHGFPVVRLLLAWLLASYALSRLFAWLDRLTRDNPGPLPQGRRPPSAFAPAQALALLLCLALAVIAVRGTLRQGPPLRWGDAFTTNSLLANHLGLNGTLSLYAAAKSRLSDERDRLWKARMPADRATALTRQLLLGNGEQLVDQPSAAARRDYVPPIESRLPVRNVVVILMESFAA